jgi:predicted PurR-regulated permease PerM/CheY-like chemotaxis protein
VIDGDSTARRPWPQPIVLAGLVLTVACLYWARVVFIPIALAMLFAFLLSPAVALVRRTGLPQVPAVFVVVVLACLLAGGFGWALFTQLTALANDLPSYRATIIRKIVDIQKVGRGGALEKVEDTAKDVLAQIEETGQPHQKPLPVVVSPPHPVWQIPRVLEPLGSAVLVLVLLLFMLIQQRDLRARVIRLFGEERLAETTRVLDEAGERISRYLLTQTGLNAFVGGAVATGLFFLGMPFSLVCGFFAALLRFIPYVGAWVAALLPIFMSLAVFDGWLTPLLIAGLFIVTESVAAFMLEPLFSARSAGVSSIALLIAAAFWAWLWGPIGLALAIPLTVCLVVFSRTVDGLEFIEILVADEPGLPQHVIYYQRVLAGDTQDAAAMVAEAAKTGSRDGAYDAILVPALARARHDVETGQLTPAEYAHVVETTREVLDRVGRGAAESAPAASAPARAESAIVVAGCPARDEADRVVLEVLGRLLESSGLAIRVAPAGGLVSEMLARIQAARPSLVFLGSLEGNGRARHLAKRLRAACPEAPIVVGCWGLRVRPEVRADLDLAGVDDVVTSLADARSAVLRLTSLSAPCGATENTSEAGWVDLEPAIEDLRPGLRA